MAILGFQLVSTLLGASILSKIINYTSFAGFLLCRNLLRYMPPSSDELLKASNVNIIKNDKNKRNRKNPEQNEQQMNVLKSLSVELKRIPVVFRDLYSLHYFTDYQWLLDFSFCSTIVFLSNEFVYGCLVGTVAKVNLSVIWCIIGTVFTIKSLFTVNRVYFSMKDAADMMIVIMSGFSFLVFAMIVLIIPEKHLNFSFVEAYRNFTDAVYQNIPSSSGPMSLTWIKAFLAIVSAIIGALFTHSGLRFGKMYVDGVNEAESPLKKLLLHLSFIFPTVILCLWLTPVQNYLLTVKIGTRKLTVDDLMSLRIYFTVAFCLFRIIMSSSHLQAYLNLADARIKSLRKEAGKITVLEFQKIVARIFCCLCLVAIQYFAPIILCLNVALLYKCFGGLTWMGSYSLPFNPPFYKNTTADNSSLPFSLMPFMSDLQDSVEEWSTSVINFRSIFTNTFYESIFGYILWFVLAAIQITGFLGLAYHRNLIM